MLSTIMFLFLKCNKKIISNRSTR